MHSADKTVDTLTKHSAWSSSACMWWGSVGAVSAICAGVGVYVFCVRPIYLPGRPLVQGSSSKPNGQLPHKHSSPTTTVITDRNSSAPEHFGTTGTPLGSKNGCPEKEKTSVLKSHGDTGDNTTGIPDIIPVAVKEFSGDNTTAFSLNKGHPLLDLGCSVCADAGTDVVKGDGDGDRDMGRDRDTTVSELHAPTPGAAPQPPGPNTFPKMHHFSEAYVKRLMDRVVCTLSGRSTPSHTKWLEHLARASEAATMVFSRDTWFQELQTCIQNKHHLVGASLKCPLTLRVAENGLHHTVLLNAFIEYDIRLSSRGKLPDEGSSCTPTTAAPISSSSLSSTPDDVRKMYERHVQQRLGVMLSREIETEDNYHPQRHHHRPQPTFDVHCQLACSPCTTNAMGNLLGIPLVNSIVSHVVSRLLAPGGWTFDTPCDLCEYTYAQCLGDCQDPASNMTADRVCAMFSSRSNKGPMQAPQNNKGDHEGKLTGIFKKVHAAFVCPAAAAAAATAASEAVRFLDQPLAAVLCSVTIPPPPTTGLVSDSETDVTRTDMHSAMQLLAKTHGGRLVVEACGSDLACGVLVHATKSMEVNAHLRKVAQKAGAHVQTFVINVQNRATVKHVPPRLAHITMIEVV